MKKRRVWEVQTLVEDDVEIMNSRLYYFQLNGSEVTDCMDFGWIKIILIIVPQASPSLKISNTDSAFYQCCTESLTESNILPHPLPVIKMYEYRDTSLQEDLMSGHSIRQTNVLLYHRMCIDQFHLWGNFYDKCHTVDTLKSAFRQKSFTFSLWPLRSGKSLKYAEIPKTSSTQTWNINHSQKCDITQNQSFPHQHKQRHIP